VPGLDLEANLNLVVKCKDLMQYTLDLNVTIPDHIEVISLTKPPEPLAGGANIPVSIFNLPSGTQMEQAALHKYEKIQIVKQHKQAAPSYKLSHYEHMKAFIKKHEKIGNMIKFARDQNQYAIGYQHCAYGDRKPHFFIYDVQKRSVVRRFNPLSPVFSISDFQEDADEMLMQSIF
jgi:hypothetical protein